MDGVKGSAIVDQGEDCVSPEIERAVRTALERHRKTDANQLQRKVRYELAGLLGFTLSGLVFAGDAVRRQDWPTFVGSLLWILACVVWAVPATF